MQRQVVSARESFEIRFMGNWELEQRLFCPRTMGYIKTRLFLIISNCFDMYLNLFSYLTFNFLYFEHFQVYQPV